METKTPPEPKTDDNVKKRIPLAFCLGLPSFLLILFFAQGFLWSLHHGGPVFIWGLCFFVVVGGYFLVLSYLLLRGNPFQWLPLRDLSPKTHLN